MLTGCFNMRHKTFRNFMLFWLLLACLLAILASLLIATPLVYLIAAGVAAIPMAYVSGRFIKGKNEAGKLRHFQRLLAFLSSRVAAGQTLERSLMEASSVLTKELGPKHGLVLALARSRQQLVAQMNMEAVLQSLASHFNLMRVSTLLAILTPLNRHGGRIDIFLRRSHDALNKELQMVADVQAERSQTSSETMVLLILPYVIAVAMGDFYRGTWSGASWQTVATLAIFALTVMSALIAIMVLSPEMEKRAVVREKVISKKRLSKTSSLLASFYLNRLPGSVGYLLRQAAHDLEPDAADAFLTHLSKKPFLLFLGFFMAMLSITGLGMTPLALPLFLLLPWILADVDLILKNNKRAESYRILLPIMQNLLAVLLESGLTLDTSLQSLPIPPRYAHGTHAERALFRVKQGLQLGQPADVVLATLADECPVSELTASLHLTARYARQGGHELLGLLAVAADNTWHVYRVAIQRTLERRALYLMLPMGLDLLAVILVAVLPAIASMPSF